MSKEKEEWRPIAGFEGYYDVSDWGRVKSLARIVMRKDGRRYPVPERILTPTPDNRGYLTVTLNKNGEKTAKKVHPLVWDTFVDTDRTGLQINHIDENKENNRLWNLNLLTGKENSNYGTRNVRIAKANSRPVVAKDPITLKVIYEFPSAREADRSGFDSGHISECCNGKRKTHKGLLWQWA